MRIGQQQFEDMAIASADEGRVRKHGILSRRIVRQLLAVIEPTGNLARLGAPEQALERLVRRAGLSSNSGPKVSPLEQIVAYSLAEWLVRWWFNNKSHGTQVLARLRSIDERIAAGCRSWVIAPKSQPATRQRLTELRGALP